MLACTLQSDLVEIAIFAPEPLVNTTVQFDRNYICKAQSNSMFIATNGELLVQPSQHPSLIFDPYRV
jgi:hypothetical protein